MFDNTFINKLKDKYNYDEKTVKALSLIIPALINYYGDDYSEIVLNAIFNCEIIPCNSHQTISKVLNERKLTKFVGGSPVSDIDIKRAESVYIPNVEIIYNAENNSYEINKVDRVIVTSHTYNYDSLKGLEILTRAICSLVKSYNDEIIIDENVVTIRYGISYEKRKIIYDNEIVLDFIEDYGKGLEEGFNLYDTEKVVSSIYSDEYKCYDFASIYTVASILKEKYGLQKEINDFELIGDYENLEKKYGRDLISGLSSICDKCVCLENDMFLSFTREDKNNYAKNINKILSEDIYDKLVFIYQKKKNVKN